VEPLTTISSNIDLRYLSWTHMRILIAEDKRSLANHMGRALENEGHTISVAYDGDRALSLGRTALYDLVLLDVMLPKMDGFSVIRSLRDERLRTQTILVSARDSMDDIIRGLDAGADDYLTKPFPLDVLLAKVRATERRIPRVEPQTAQFEELTLRPHLCELQRGERIEPLTRTECALLDTLMRRARTIVPHTVLIDEGWGPGADVSLDSLYVFIRALRSKITRPGEPSLLHTIRGVGYTLRGEIS
jgi:DNA-binding response OmpR family regulator